MTEAPPIKRAGISTTGIISSRSKSRDATTKAIPNPRRQAPRICRSVADNTSTGIARKADNKGVAKTKTMNSERSYRPDTRTKRANHFFILRFTIQALEAFLPAKEVQNSIGHKA
jgi:hypothetical protein